VLAGTASNTWTVGGTPFRLRLSPSGSRLYVANSVGKVVVLNTANGQPVDTINALGSGINGMALSADGAQLYVSGIGGNIAEIATATGVVLRTFIVPGTLQDIALSPDNAELWAARASGAVLVVSRATGAVIDSVVTGGDPFGLNVSPDGRFVVVGFPNGIGPGGGKVLAIDRVIRRVVRTFSVGDMPRRIAFDASGTTVAVANEANGVDVIR